MSASQRKAKHGVATATKSASARGSLFERTMRGLEEAVAHSRGDPSDVRVHYPPDDVDVAAIRRRAKLTQDAFAKRFGFTLDSVQNWEAKRKKPSGAARILLTIIDKEPDAVTRALKLA